MKDPATDQEFRRALESVECELIDHGGDTYSVRYERTGSQTRLGADNYSDALMEAWNLVKP